MRQDLALMARRGATWYRGRMADTRAGGLTRRGHCEGLGPEIVDESVATATVTLATCTGEDGSDGRSYCLIEVFAVGNLVCSRDDVCPSANGDAGLDVRMEM